MKLKNVLIVVNDIQKSKHFYKELFGLDTVLDGDANVILTEGLVLQDASVWKTCLNREVLFGNRAMELYFEETEIEAFVKKVEAYEESIVCVTPLTELGFGQKVLRICDPDGHLIEVRTPMAQM